MNLKRPLFSLLCLLMLWAGSLTPTVSAQDGLSYEEETRLQLDALGLIGRAIGKRAIESKTTITENYHRSDSKDASTIIDVPGGRFVMLNHKEKEYSEMTFDEMMAQFGQYAEDAETQTTEAQEEMENMEGEYEFAVDVDATGEREEINGVNTRQLVVTVEVLATTEEGESFKFFGLGDIRNSEDIENADVVTAFHQNYAGQMGIAAAGTDMAAALAPVMDQYPRLGAAMQKLKEESAKAPGMPVRTTFYFVAAPADAELDRNAILNPEKKKRRRGFGRIARRAMRDRGLPVGDGEEEKPKEIEEQTLIMTSITESKNFKSGQFSDEMFQVPSDYKKVEFPTYQQSSGN